MLIGYPECMASCRFCGKTGRQSDIDKQDREPIMFDTITSEEHADTFRPKQGKLLQKLRGSQRTCLEP